MPQEKQQRHKASKAARREQIRLAQERRRKKNRFIALVVIIGLLGGLFLAISLTGDDGTDVATDSTSTTKPDTSTSSTMKAVDPVCPKADGSSEKQMNFTKAPGMCIDPAKSYTATMKTSKGVIELALDAKLAPKTVNNFVFLSRYHYYDGLTFHRVVPGFVIQGGDPTGTGSGGPGYQFEDELPKPEDYKAGGLAMANSGPGTNGSQFFILESDDAAKTLVQAVQGKANYSLFGQVTQGLDVVKAIIALADASTQKTSETVFIESVTIKES